MGDILLPPVRLEDLDDTTPAGPYPHTIDDIALMRLCLEIIRIAVWDARKNPRNMAQARKWLAKTGVVWIRALGVGMGLSRQFTDAGVRDLFYGPCLQPDLGLDDEEDDDLGVEENR